MESLHAWYDTNVREDDWKKGKGFKELTNYDSYIAAKLVDYSGKMVILWDKYVYESACEEKMIWCEEIALENPNIEEYVQRKWFAVHHISLR